MDKYIYSVPGCHFAHASSLYIKLDLASYLEHKHDINTWQDNKHL